MQSSTEQVENKIHNEIGILNKLISIPAEPIAVKWEIDESKETGRGSLRALLKFNEGDKVKILKNSPPFDKQLDDTLSADIFERWLPGDAKTGIETTLKENRYTLIGIHALQPDLFTQTELSPYVNGSITPLSGGYILVSLYSM